MNDDKSLFAATMHTGNDNSNNDHYYYCLYTPY